ncbi:transglutaminase family protein [Candidatus Uabimicrobium amorphum]|uniref:Protein SirB1 N-terminal domain-containing protein n=1 Tax=Uabimicrobium amorphum TaxID=2596890 RepID=A0A5S9IM83_UABAM|nr:transglutaminase family protein [Candidatus Uabimicrobium amorphum]BBM83145.1 hypothetical protein UABAM_01496 [Candidatus Uabimicrobium amorphum]
MKYTTILIIVISFLFAHGQSALLQTPHTENYNETLAKYPFRFSPTSAQTVISKLKKTTQVPLTISTIEKPLLKDALDGRFDSFSISEAALIASGITDKNLRTVYQKKIHSIFQTIRRDLPAKTSQKKIAFYLLLYLHKNHLQHYDIRSSSLPKLLDDGIYNCVSSSLLYNILAQKLGLDVRGVEAPEHCFSIVYHNGNAWDIETTSPAGFDAAHAKDTTKITVHTDGYVMKKSLRREMSVDRQVAMIYYNRGVDLGKKKQYIASTVEYFKALLIDNDFHTACQNTIVNFAYYARQLSAKGKTNKALQILKLGLELAPNDKNLRNDLYVMMRNWSIDLIQNKKFDRATQVLQKAQKYFPRDRDLAFLICSAQLQKALGHKQNFLHAMQILQRAIDSADKEIQSEIRQARWYVIDEHARYQTRKNQWQKAIAIYEWGLALKEGETLRNNWIKTYIDWAESIQNSDKLQAIAIYEKALESSPQKAHFQSRVMLLYQEMYNKELQRQKHARAFAWITRLYEMFPNEQAVKNNLWYVYQEWHKHLIKNKKYNDAHQNFRDVTTKFPQEYTSIRGIYTAVSNEYAMNYAQKNVYSHALAIYSGLRQNLPEDKQIENNFHYLLQEGVKHFLAQKKYASIHQLTTILRKKLPQEERIMQIVVTQLVKNAQETKEPYAVYQIAKCLRNFPTQKNISDSLINESLRLSYVQKNDKALWKIYSEFSQTPQITDYMRKICYNRGAQLINGKVWRKAFDFHRQALTQFPNDGKIRERLAYIRSQLQE